MASVYLTVAAGSQGTGGSSALPLWAGVVLALAGGGFVGGLVTALVQSRAQAREQWRMRLLTAADEFSQSFWAAWQQLWSVLDAIYKRWGELSDGLDLTEHETELLDAAEPLVQEVLMHLTRVNLLFGSASPVAERARAARRELKGAFNELDADPDYPLADSDRARTRLSHAEKEHDAFSDAARLWAISGRARGPFSSRFRLQRHSSSREDRQGLS